MCDNVENQSIRNATLSVYSFFRANRTGSRNTKMDSANLELLILLCLIIVNGVLSMSEMALVSSRAGKLEPLAKSGDPRATVVIGLLREPGTFLSTVQIGVTLIGILIGVFSGGLIAQIIAEQVSVVQGLSPYSQAIGVGVVVVITTYLSLVVGELVPKRLGMRFAEPLAMAVARPLRTLSTIAYPLVRVLDYSSHGVLRLLRVPKEQEAGVSEDEVRFLLRQGTDLGVFEPLEHDMVGRVFRLADQKMSALLTPRPDIVWLDATDSPDEIRQKVVESGRSRFPVADGDLDRVVGVVLAKDLFAQYTEGQPMDLVSIMRPPIFVPETAPALTAIERMKLAQSKIAFVIDEYGGLAGLVTIDDVMGAIVGEIVEENEEAEPMIVARADGGWLIDGMLTIGEFCDHFEIDPLEADGSYSTVGGLVMATLGQVPKTGDVATWMGLSLEVVDMDGRRVDKILAQQLNGDEDSSDEDAGDDDAGDEDSNKQDAGLEDRTEEPGADEDRGDAPGAKSKPDS